MLVVLVLEGIFINGCFFRDNAFTVPLFDPGVHLKYVLNEAIKELVNVLSRLHGAFPHTQGIKSVRDRLDVRGQPIQGLGGVGVQV